MQSGVEKKEAGLVDYLEKLVERLKREEANK